MSLPIPDIIAVLRGLNVPPDILVKAETELENIEADKKAEAVAAPKQKSQYVTVVLDPERRLVGQEFVSLVVKLPAEQDAGDTLNRLYRSVYDQRAAAKRKRVAVNTVADAAGGVKRKFLKQNGLHIVTKEPVRVLISDNTIPAA
jgi:hypothetical protein